MISFIVQFWHFSFPSRVFPLLLNPPQVVNSCSVSLCSISHRQGSPLVLLYAIATSASVPACFEWSPRSPFSFSSVESQNSNLYPYFSASLSIYMKSFGQASIDLSISFASLLSNMGTNKFTQAVCELATCLKANRCGLYLNSLFWISFTFSQILG